MKKVMILMLSLIMLSGSAMGQRRVRMTQEQMTEKMVNELKLDEKQTKKVTKLNKKFKKLIEGEQQDKMKGQRPPMGQGRPEGNHGGGRPGGGFGGGMHGGPRGGMPPGGNHQESSYDYDKQQTKYDEQMRKLLSDEQYEGYLKLKPQFYSQRRIREFLMGGNGLSNEMGMPPGDTVSTETGKVDVTLGDGCIWTLTGDTFITSFTGDASQIKLNGHRLFVNGKVTAQAGTDSQ